MHQASSAYGRLQTDAAAVTRAHDDLSNRIAAGLPVDNVTKQLGVYDTALQQLNNDLSTYQTAAKTLGYSTTIPGLSTKTIGAEQTAAQKAVGQYGYIYAKTDFDTARQQYLQGSLSSAAFKKAEQGAIQSVGGLSVSGAQKRYDIFSIQSQFDKAYGSVQRQQQVKTADLQLQAAQINASKLQLRGDTPAQATVAAQSVYTAAIHDAQIQAKYNMTGVTGQDKALYLQDANNKALDALNTTLQTIAQNTLKPLTEAFTLAQLHGNVAGEQAATAAQVQYLSSQGALKNLYGGDKTAQSIGVFQATQQGAQAGLKPFTDAIQLAQLQNNIGAERKAIGGEITYDKTHLNTLFGGDKTAQQIAILQLQKQALGLTVLPGPQLFRPTTAGIGQLDQGFGTSGARLAGAGASQMSLMIATLQAQLARAEDTIRRQDQMIAALNKGNTTADKIERNTRPHTAPPAKSQPHYNHLRGAPV